MTAAWMHTQIVLINVDYIASKKLQQQQQQKVVVFLVGTTQQNK